MARSDRRRTAISRRHDAWSPRASRGSEAPRPRASPCRPERSRDAASGSGVGRVEAAAGANGDRVCPYHASWLVIAEHRDAVWNEGGLAPAGRGGVWLVESAHAAVDQRPVWRRQDADSSRASPSASGQRRLRSRAAGRWSTPDDAARPSWRFSGSGGVAPWCLRGAGSHLEGLDGPGHRANDDRGTDVLSRNRRPLTRTRS